MTFGASPMSPVMAKASASRSARAAQKASTSSRGRKFKCGSVIQARRFMGGLSGQFLNRTRKRPLPAKSAVPPSTVDDIDREPAPGRFLVLVVHVHAGLAHGFDHAVQGDAVSPV